MRFGVLVTLHAAAPLQGVAARCQVHGPVGAVAHKYLLSEVYAGVILSWNWVISRQKLVQTL